MTKAGITTTQSIIKRKIKNELQKFDTWSGTERKQTEDKLTKIITEDPETIKTFKKTKELKEQIKKEENRLIQHLEKQHKIKCEIIKYDNEKISVKTSYLEQILKEKKEKLLNLQDELILKTTEEDIDIKEILKSIEKEIKKALE